MKASLRKPPVGLQTFSELRERNLLYVDKTGLIYNLVQSPAKYNFLSRPRRFGKSLLVSTLKSYFEGRRDLFEGLAIADLETEWNEYPVLHFDMSRNKHLDDEQLEYYLGLQVGEYERIYHCENGVIGSGNRLDILVRRVYEMTGKQVVLLIDEYDAPLLDVMHEEDNLPKLRNIMRNFYSPLKACDPYLRFVFLTGITKFSQLSIFSELNNISNISMLPQYASICGISSDELQTQMRTEVENMASNMGLAYEQLMQKLKDNYDGYHFTPNSPDIYNPFSLLNAMLYENLKSYWFGSGTPTYLIEMLRKYGVRPSEIGGVDAMASDFDAPTEKMTSIMPLLYQSGYITIKNYSPTTEIYHLDFPNKEVRTGLLESLLPSYLHQYKMKGMVTIGRMYECIHNDDFECALEHLKTFLSTVPYCDNTDYEGHWQQVLYIIFSLLGAYLDVEVRTATGRVDMVMRAQTKLYVIELKLDKTAEIAIEQINLKQYDKRFALSGLPIVKVGINFDTDTHTLDRWVIEE